MFRAQHATAEADSWTCIPPTSPTDTRSRRSAATYRLRFGADRSTATSGHSEIQQLIARLAERFVSIGPGAIDDTIVEGLHRSKTHSPSTRPCCGGGVRMTAAPWLPIRGSN